MTELPQGASLLKVLEIGATQGPLKSLAGSSMNQWGPGLSLKVKCKKEQELNLFWWLISQSGWPRPGQPAWVSGITREQYRVALDIYKEIIDAQA